MSYVSSDKQVKEGDSIPAQRDALRKYIDSHDDLTFYDEYIDDGISGTKNDREELQRLLNDVINNNVDLILCTKMDRLHRSLRNFLNMQDILEKHHCNWLAIWEPMYDTSTPQGKMIINTMMNLAQFEAENTGNRIRQVQAYKVSKGEVITGITPPGYKIVDKHLVPDENAENVRKCFEHYSLHGGLNAVIRYAAQFPGFPRTQAAFKLLLKNEKYTGTYRGNPNFCEPIISKELFEDVQRKINMNVKKSQKRVYIFSGLMICDECGRKLGALTRTYHYKSGDKKVISYRCVAHYGRGIIRCGNTKIIKEHLLEDYLIQNIKGFISDYITTQNAIQKPAEDNRTRISALKRKMSRLKDLYVDDLISIDEYKADKAKFEEELKELEKLSVPDPVDLSGAEQFLSMDIEAYYKDLTREEKRFFWRSIFKEIRFGNDRTLNPVLFLGQGSIK